MRHNKSGRKLNRTSQHRKALFCNMAKAIIAYGKIHTTEAKAKELRRVIEPLVTLAKRNDLHSRRLAYKALGSHQMVQKLFDEIAPKYAGVPGGYTRVVKLGMPRKGDAAPLAVIEFVEPAGAAAPKAKKSKSKEETLAKVKEALQPETVAEAIKAKVAEELAPSEEESALVEVAGRPVPDEVPAEDASAAEAPDKGKE